MRQYLFQSMAESDERPSGSGGGQRQQEWRRQAVVAAKCTYDLEIHRFIILRLFFYSINFFIVNIIR